MSILTIDCWLAHICWYGDVRGKFRTQTDYRDFHDKPWRDFLSVFSHFVQTMDIILKTCI